MDVQVTYLRDVLTVTSVTNVPDMEPRTLDIRGPDFRSVERVEINEYPSSNFVVASKTRLLAEVPVEQESKVVRSIAILSSKFTHTERSQVKFEFTNNPRRLQGLQKMIQTFLLILLRTPGSDAFYQNIGGGVQRLIGATFSKSNTGSISADFVLAVSRTRSQIITLQASNPRLSPDERLAAANVMSSVFSPTQTALLVRVELVAQSGKRAAVGLEL